MNSVKQDVIQEQRSKTFILSRVGDLFENVDVFDWIREAIDGIEIVKARTKAHTRYYNVAAAFDIETTSCILDDEKMGVMYAWVFGLNGRCVIGRTWGQYKKLMDALVSTLELSVELHLPIYIHNAMFDMQWVLAMHQWYDVFAIGTRKVARAVTKDGLEFRCSYLLTNKSLASLGKECKHYPVQKMVGDLDYTLKRHPKTPLTQKELGYITGDANVVMSYIQQQIDIEGYVYQIPMTKTGYARRYVRHACFSKEFKEEYTKIMKRLRITLEEYKLAKRCFQGGFTHNCYLYRNRLCYDMQSEDATSFYPSQLCTFDGFPIGRGHKVQVKSYRQLKWFCANSFVMMDAKFVNIRAKTNIDHTISRSRCYECSDDVFCDNGRVVKASWICTSICNLDLDVIEMFYEWDELMVNNVWVYHKGRLPKPFILPILKLYGDKTTLKGIKGMEMEYALSKETLNSCYGMTVMDIYRPEILFKNDEWVSDFPDMEKAISDYNLNFGRFTFYLWGVATTAAARKRILECVYHIGSNGDYVYTDTDSIKYLHPERYEQFFEDMNNRILEENKEAAKYYDLPIEMFEPKSSDGKKHPLGVFEFDGRYKLFKSLGAKRYLVLTEKYDLYMTVSGLNKRVCVPWMIEKWGKYGAFRAFDDELYVPPEKTGKMTHNYIDYPVAGYLEDYLGNKELVYEARSIYLEPCEYDMSFDRTFMQLLNKNVFDVRV